MFKYNIDAGIHIVVSAVLWLFGFLCVMSGAKCECGHTMRVGMVLVVRPYVHHTYIE